jgi:hypothetical protein
VWALSGEFEFGGQQTQRGAQFVAGVGDEPALPAQRGMQAGKESIEGRAPAGDLIPGGGNRLVTRSDMRLPEQARSRAVLIRASQFTDSLLPDLPAVRNNLGSLKEILTSPSEQGCHPSTARCWLIPQT